MSPFTAGDSQSDTFVLEPHAKPASQPEPATKVARAFLDKLLRLRLLDSNQLAAFLEGKHLRLSDFSCAEEIGNALVEARLLTQYQLERVRSGRTHGLLLGNNRVRDRLGAGGMGVVFRAEHIFLKREVAVKVIPADENCPADLLNRFYAEMRVLAGLQHPNIVLAFDAGWVPASSPGEPPLLYLAMELVDGWDLENIVVENGPVSIAEACNWIGQAATGLQEAHDHNLIHRDIKPSNLLLSKQGQVKIADFGLVRQFCQPLTQRKTLIGTLEYMAPEQAEDASTVGVAADMYGLGACLFWLLSGESPYPHAKTVTEALTALRETPPRRLADLRPDVPAELDALVASMLERNPMKRPVLPLSIVRSLRRFMDAPANATVTRSHPLAANAHDLPAHTRSRASD